MKVLKAKIKNGLSLIEVLLALGVLTVGILAVVGIFPGIFRINANTWRTTEVMILAQQTMDEILSQNQYIDTSPVTVNPAPTQIPRDSDGVPVGYVKYWGTSDPGGNPNIQIINVEVVWVAQGRTKTYKLKSAISP